MLNFTSGIFRSFSWIALRNITLSSDVLEITISSLKILYKLTFTFNQRLSHFLTTGETLVLSIVPQTIMWERKKQTNKQKSQELEKWTKFTISLIIILSQFLQREKKSDSFSSELLLWISD